MRARYIHYVASLYIKGDDENFSGRVSGMLEADPNSTPVDVFKYIQMVCCQSLGVMQTHCDQVIVEVINPIQ